MSLLEEPMASRTFKLFRAGTNDLEDRISGSVDLDDDDEEEEIDMFVHDFNTYPQRDKSFVYSSECAVQNDTDVIDLVYLYKHVTSDTSIRYLYVARSIHIEAVLCFKVIEDRMVILFVVSSVPLAGRDVFTRAVELAKAMKLRDIELESLNSTVGPNQASCFLARGSAVFDRRVSFLGKTYEKWGFVYDDNACDAGDPSTKEYGTMTMCLSGNHENKRTAPRPKVSNTVAAFSAFYAVYRLASFKVSNDRTVTSTFEPRKFISDSPTRPRRYVIHTLFDRTKKITTCRVQEGDDPPIKHTVNVIDLKDDAEESPLWEDIERMCGPEIRDDYEQDILESIHAIGGLVMLPKLEYLHVYDLSESDADKIMLELD